MWDIPVDSEAQSVVGTEMWSRTQMQSVSGARGGERKRIETECDRN